MPTFNTLFTHEKQAIYSARAHVCVEGRGENEWALPPHSDLLYHSLTIWIANRTIYHGGGHLFYGEAAPGPVPRGLWKWAARIMKLK